MKTNTVTYFKFLLCFLLISSISVKSLAQSVGVVLSGGGASAMAHVGFLKALEENNIPIDYIVGTSAGALVASLYASGYSPQEIDSLLISEKFLLMSTGEIEEKYKFFFKKSEADASLFSIDFSKKFNSESFIPANFISPNMLDFELMTLLSSPHPKVKDYDSLFIPFRCVASDVTINKPILFKKGNLTETVRASMTYPFYMNPIKINGSFLYDGGIYNNFPSDVMYNDFLPDVIIGCNLSDTLILDDQDFISQLKSIILSRKNNDFVCDNGIVIKPTTSVGTFDFKNSNQAVTDGYISTMKLMDSIKNTIYRRVNVSDLNIYRTKYKEKHKNEIFIDSITIIGVSSSNTKTYIKKSLIKSNQKIHIKDIKKNYFRLIEEPSIQHIFPKLIINQKTGNYVLVLDITLNKEFTTKFGGVFSSSPINTAFVGLEFKQLGKVSKQVSLNSYFGKLYGSVNGTFRIDFPSRKIPFGFSLDGAINSWDFFRSYATFFEDVKPSFIVINEYFSSVTAHLPITNRSTFNLSYNNFYYENDYYQTEAFTPSDTSDLVKFFGSKYSASVVRSNLNEKLFASKGSLMSFGLYYVKGDERFIPGSTSIVKDNINQTQQWLKFSLLIDSYFKLSHKMSLGFFHNTVLSTNYQFSNYFSTQIFSSQFSPIEQMRAMFINNFRSNNYTSLGLKHIYSIRPKVQLRNEGYLFSPIISITSGNSNQTITLSRNFLSYFPILKSSVVAFTPLGPISLSAVYIYPEKKPFLFQLNFGYIIQNKKILD